MNEEDLRIVARWEMTYAETKAWVIKYEIPVFILKTDEIEEVDYAVIIIGTEYWLDAFKTKKEALHYCKELGLKVKRI
jgi:hypothetical protein